MTKCIKQTGPTCGIYAFINGMNNINPGDISREQADNMVHSVLKANIIKNNDTNNSKTGITFIGEFFDFQIYSSFLNKFKDNFAHKNIDYDIAIKDINCLEDNSVIRYIQAKKCFILFSIATPIPWWNPVQLYYFLVKRHRNSHWLTICDYDYSKSKYIVTNSSSGKIKGLSFKKLKLKNKPLTMAMFYWQYYKRSKKLFTFRKKTIENPIENSVQAQLENKNAFLSTGILDKTINHTSGQIIIVQKIEK